MARGLVLLLVSSSGKEEGKGEGGGEALDGEIMIRSGGFFAYELE